MPKRSEPRVRALLFDLGKVLLHFDFRPAFRRLARVSGKTPDDIETYFVSSGLEVLYDGGKITSRRFYSEVRTALDLRIGFDGFRRIWNDIFSPIPEMIRLVENLAPRYRLVLISNTNEMHFRHVTAKYRVLDLFDRHVVSYREKKRKPDGRLYRIAAKACKARPSEIFYVDDREDLTQAAHELGFKTFTFRRNPKDLKKRMKELGIL